MPNASKFGNLNLLEPSGPVQGLFTCLNLNQVVTSGLYRIKSMPLLHKTLVYIPKYVTINAACVCFSLPYDLV
jgi:hypothetical protein